MSRLSVLVRGEGGSTCVELHTVGVGTLIVNRRSAAVLCEAKAAADFDSSSELGCGRSQAIFDILKNRRDTPRLTQSLLCIPRWALFTPPLSLPPPSVNH